MASWLTPQASQQIQKGISDLGAVFKPPSISEMYVAAKMRADQQGAERKQAAIQAIRSTNPTLANFFQTEVNDPAGQYAKADIYQQAQQPGATPQALDTRSYAIHGNAQQTFTGQGLQLQNELLKTSMTPVAEDATRFNAPVIQQRLGVPGMQQGTVGASADEYKYIPGANGQIDRENPLEGPEGDKTMPKPMSLGQDVFGNPIMGTVQKGPNGQPIGVPLPVQGRDPIASALQPGAAPAPAATPFGGLSAVGGAAPGPVSPMDPAAQMEQRQTQAVAQGLGLDHSAIAGKRGKDLMDYLEQAAPDKASTVRSILEGRAAYPEGFFLKTPYGQALASLTTRVDPSFDAANFKTRAAVQKEFAAGGPSSPAAQITFGNTAMQHLGRLHDLVPELDNFEGLGPFNYIANVVRNAGKVASGTADTLKAFQATKQNAMDEVAKFYTSTGGSAEERKARVKQIDDASSPSELRAVIKEQIHDIFAKTNSLQDRWHQGVGNAVPDFPVINKSTRAVLERVGLVPTQGGDAASRAQIVAPGSPQAAGPAAHGAPAGGPVKIATPDDYARLPSGARFIDPNGQERTKR